MIHKCIVNGVKGVVLEDIKCPVCGSKTKIVGIETNNEEEPRFIRETHTYKIPYTDDWFSMASIGVTENNPQYYTLECVECHTKIQIRVDDVTETTYSRQV